MAYEEILILRTSKHVGSMDTRLFTKTLTETVSLDQTLPPKMSRFYEPLIQSVTSVISETRPLSTSYTTRSIMDALFSPRPRTRYFVGWDSRASWLLRNLLPDRMLDALFVALIPDSVAVNDQETELSVKQKPKEDQEMVMPLDLRVSMAQTTPRHR